MAKTIRVIDLLNKIANGEEVPEKILYKEKIFEFDKLEKCYITSNFDNTVMNDLGIYLDDGLNMNSLNDTVEIIEEQQDINIQDIEEVKPDKYSEDGEPLYSFNNIVNKINEIQKAVKQLNNKIKDKE